MKSYTNIKQSKKLAKILPSESADMCHLKTYILDDLDWRFDDKALPLLLGNTPLSEMSRSTLPCWSLTALLNILSPAATLDISEGPEKYYRLHCKERFSEWYDNPIDACYEMILKLNTLNLL